MSASTRKQGILQEGEALKYPVKRPKFGPNGTKYGTKSERKRRNNRVNRRGLDNGRREIDEPVYEITVNGEKIKSEYLYLEPQVLPVSRLQERINNIK